MNIGQQALIPDTIRETLTGLIGERVEIRANMGRSKIAEYEGTLTQTYPAIFTVEVDRKRGRTARQSYQYVDVLTGIVELTQEGEPVFGAFIEEEEEVVEISGEEMLGEQLLGEAMQPKEKSGEEEELLGTAMSKEDERQAESDKAE